MTTKDLHIFLTGTMSMSEVYQPVIIKHLLEVGGTCRKNELAARLADNDASVQEYYQRILMRWPKKVLSKHKIISYDRRSKTFQLLPSIDEGDREELIRICDAKISEWLQTKSATRGGRGVASSKNYEVIAAAKGRCQLCGISSEVSPMDADHIVPKSRANKNGKVVIDGRLVDVDSMENLQCLCFRCNRSKRDGDDTDWRRTKKLVRDQIPNQIRSEGRDPIVRKLTGSELKKGLLDKLEEEVAEYLRSEDADELADIQEVVLALGKIEGRSQYDMEKVRVAKVRDSGGFAEGWFYEGDR